jgi:hypothetical protein
MVRSGAMIIWEFSKTWKLNFCRRERKLIKNQKYTGGKNMSAKVQIYRLSKYVGLQAKVSAKGGLPLGQGGPGCMAQAPMQRQYVESCRYLSPTAECRRGSVHVWSARWGP